MKTLLLTLTVGIASCSSNSTSSPVVLNHPFPGAFGEVIVTYQNLPGQWSDEWEEWDYSQTPPLDTSWGTSGNGLSGSFTFSFDSSSSFRQSGDTIRGNWTPYPPTFSCEAIVDKANGILDVLDLSENISEYTSANSYGVACQNIAYEPDSNGNFLVKLSGQEVQAGLVNLSGSSYNGTPDVGHSSGSSNSTYQSYIDTLSSIATLTIRFIP
jgi:hypothetical protein